MKRREFVVSAGMGATALFAPAGWDRSDRRRETAPDSGASRAGQADARLEVNLGCIVAIFARIRPFIRRPVMAVVKANAYGHGLIPVSKALERTGADWLMVGKLHEACILREAGVRLPILNFGPFDRADAEILVASGVSQSVYGLEAAWLDEAASRKGKTAGVHIDVDTGMGRTGVDWEKALSLIEQVAGLPHLKIEGISTTLTEDPVYDLEQVKRFLFVCVQAEQRGIRLGLKHAASSAGILGHEKLHLDMVRPGITLYGYYPNASTRKEDKLGLEPALRLSARVVFIKELEAGESLSYLRVYRAPKRTRVATVGIGYADGYPPALGGKGSVSIRGRLYPVLPVVTSNHLLANIGPEGPVQVGDEVLLLGDQKGTELTADVLAEKGGISDYKLLIGLNPTLPRSYLMPAEGSLPG